MLSSTAQRAILMAAAAAALCLLVSFPSAHGQTNDDTTEVSKTKDQQQPAFGHPKHIGDLKITQEMKTCDLDDPNSALSKLIAFIVKGPMAASEYVSIERTGLTPELKLQIKDNSIFLPGGNPKNAQHGFRRTDVIPAFDPTTVFTGITTFYQTIRFDPNAPLVLNHGYLLISIELPTGDHVFDIFAGSDFESTNEAHAASRNSNTIRVRDLSTKTLFDLPLFFTITYKFAIQVDWTANTLTVFASTNDEPLKKMAGPFKNDPKVLSPEFINKGEYHLQLIKFPIVDPKVPVGQRGDVPHVGLQPKIKQEHVFFSNVFVTSGSDVESGAQQTV